MYKAVAKLIKDYKHRVGFIFQDENGKTISLLNENIIELMQNGEKFNIYFDTRGAIRSYDGMYALVDIPHINVSDNESFNDIHIYTDKRLSGFISSTSVIAMKSTQFMDAVYKYCKDVNYRLIYINGMNEDIKTNAILRAMYNMNSFKNTMYCNLGQFSSIGYNEFIDIINNKCNETDYIFINNLQRLTDIQDKFDSFSISLLDKYQKVVICGTTDEKAKLKKLAKKYKAACLSLSDKP